MTGKKAPYSPGDLVFAKVKGYPAWPARVQGRQPSGRFAIFFYGTFESAHVKAVDIWPYTQENITRFATEPVVKRKGYKDGLEQIKSTPEIAPITGDLAAEPALSVGPGQARLKIVLPAPVVLKKPVRMPDGTPIKPPGSGGTPRRGVKREGGEEGGDSTPKRPHPEDPPETPSPSTVSRSGRVIKPKKFVDDAGTGPDTAEEAKVVDKIIEEPRKVWVKLVASGDLVEIMLDQDKPDRWESSQQKLQWELATARNAFKFKQQVEGGGHVPEAVRRNLEEKTALTEEEEQILRRAAVLAKRQAKVDWLRTEHQMVELGVGIRSSLSSSNPQIPRCVSQLTALLALPMQPLMLKKQPETVETLRRLRKYVGPVDQSGYSAAERADIAKGVKLVRERSATVFTRVCTLFPAFSPTSAASGGFPDYFQDQVAALARDTEGWTEEKVLGMTQEPGEP